MGCRREWKSQLCTPGDPAGPPIPIDRAKRRRLIVQSETKSRVDQVTSPAGHPVSVLRFEGDIASTSKEAVLGTYQALPKDKYKLILLDFTKVDYINSSGIALVIQMLIEAANSGQKVFAYGLSAHFTKA